MCFFTAKKKEVYLPLDCRVIQLLEFTSILFSSMFKNGGFGSGWFLLVYIHWGWVLYLLGDSGLHVNFQMVVLVGPGGIL